MKKTGLKSSLMIMPFMAKLLKAFVLLLHQIDYYEFSLNDCNDRVS